jgi:hypothetical protein
MRPALTLIAAVLTLSGCSLGGGSTKDDDESSAKPDRITEKEHRRSLTDENVVRGWLTALKLGDYRAAGDFFARDALIQQSRRYRLHTRSQAIAFNLSLPCRADLTKIVDEGARSLATFKLKDGPGGPCDGIAKVRVLVREGRFREWVQLPIPPPDGTPAPEPEPGPDGRPPPSQPA